MRLNRVSVSTAIIKLLQWSYKSCGHAALTLPAYGCVLEPMPGARVPPCRDSCEHDVKSSQLGPLYFENVDGNYVIITYK